MCLKARELYVSLAVPSTYQMQSVQSLESSMVKWRVQVDPVFLFCT